MEIGCGPARSSASAVGAGESSLAGTFRRFLAWLLDLLAVTALVFVAVTLIDAVIGPTVEIRPDAATLPATVAVDRARLAFDAVVATGLSAAYFVVPWTLVGASLGQLALRIRVRRAGSDETLPVGRATARWLLLFPPVATVSAFTIGVPHLGWFLWGGLALWYAILFLTTAGSITRQGLHDRLARSVVSKRRVSAG
jgi:RDD family